MSEALANHNISGTYFPIRSIEPLGIIRGGVMLGRQTGISVDPSEFSTNLVIRNMSTTDVAGEKIYDAAPGKRAAIERPERRKTTFAEIINTVLGVTHRDIGAAALSQLFEVVDVDYQEFIEAKMINDKGITAAINGYNNKLASTDLMLGMEAFTDATRDRHGVMYDATILEPTTRFAQWLIILESQE